MRHEGYVGIPYNELEKFVGKTVIIYHRDVKRSRLFNRTEGTIGRAPPPFVGGYEVNNYLGCPTAIWIISHDDEIFAKPL